MAIRVTEQQALKHGSPFFRDGFISIAIIGKSGCGKTRLLTEMLPHLSPDIGTVIVATVIRNNPHHLAIVDYFKRKHCMTGITHDPQELMQFTKMSEHLGHVTMAKQGMIIFDDFNVGRTTGPYWDMIVHAFTKLRNMGWNFIILAQQPSFIPTIVRNCTTARIFFDCYSKSARDTFLKDFIERVRDPLVMKTLMTYIQAVKYSYLLVQEDPFEVSAGFLNRIRPVLSKGTVVIPSLKDIMKEMNVKSMEDLEKKSKALQIDAGNTAHELFSS
jgi:ABC-type dipeptide/oligopeptide/nickel transport system ATPase component